MYICLSVCLSIGQSVCLTVCQSDGLSECVYVPVGVNAVDEGSCLPFFLLTPLSPSPTTYYLLFLFKLCVCITTQFAARGVPFPTSWLCHSIKLLTTILWIPFDSTNQHLTSVGMEIKCQLEGLRARKIPMPSSPPPPPPPPPPPLKKP